MQLPRPLNITDASKDTGVLNRYAREVHTTLQEVDSELVRQNKAIKTAQATATAAAGATSVALAGPVTGVSASESGYIIDGVLYSEVSCNYTSPSPLGTFAGVFLVIKNYRGSAELVKVAEHHYHGAGGGSANFKVTLQRTGETVTLYFVSTNAESATIADWSTAPSTTVVLDGNASAPLAPIGVSASPQQLGVFLSWTENVELNLKAYNIYRNVINNPTLADDIGTAPASGIGIATYFDKTAIKGTTYWYWITAVNTAFLESAKSTAASATAITVSLEDEVHDGPTRGAITAANTSYRPLTNPLTAHDNGVSAQINIASFVMRVANGTDVSLNSGVISGLSYATTYHVYYDDPSYAGGSVSYFANTDQAIALDATGRFYVGSILTPVAGGADTTGNNDGGTGAQSGQLYLLSPSLRADDSTDPVSWYPANDLDSDGDTSSYVDVTAVLTSWLGGFPQITSKWKSLKLKVHSQVLSINAGGTAFVDYSLDDGTTWTSVYSVVNGTAVENSATSGANDGLTGTAWTNPANIADAQNFATIAAAAHGNLSQYLKATALGFAIPASSTILGVIAKIDETVGGSATDTAQFIFRLLKAGTPAGNTRTINGVAAGTIQAGAVDDLWGTTLSDTDVNDPGFGVEVAASAPTPSSNWTGSTYYSLDGVIIDSNGNLQRVTTAGVTGAGLPTWATTVGLTTTDGTVVWTMIQTAASLVWSASHTYAAGAYVQVSVSGVNHLFQLDTAGAKMPRLVAGTVASVWSGSGGAGTSSGAFNKTYPAGSAPATFSPASLHWDGGVGINVKVYPISGNGTVGTGVSTGFYENWQAAVVGKLNFPAAGQYTFRVQQDDGFMIGFASGISKVSGTLDNPRGQTRSAKQGYTLIAGTNRGGAYTNTFVINVPSAGDWGFEINYSNWQHRGTMILNVKDSAGNYQDIIPAATALTSGGSTPTFPTWSTSFAPSYPSAVEASGNYVWFNRGPSTDFARLALTSVVLGGITVIDSNLNGQTAYRAGISSSGAQPVWSTVLNALTLDAVPLTWKNTGPTSVTTTFDFGVRNAVLQVTYQVPGSPSSRALITDEVTLPLTQNLGRLQVRYGNFQEEGDIHMHEVWVEAQAG